MGPMSMGQMSPPPTTGVQSQNTDDGTEGYLNAIKTGCATVLGGPGSGQSPALEVYASRVRSLLVNVLLAIWSAQAGVDPVLLAQMRANSAQLTPPSAT